MKRVTRLSGLATLWACVVSCSAGMAGSVDDGPDVAYLRRVVEVAVELKTTGRLPGLSPDEHGKLTAYRIRDDMRVSPFVESLMLPALEGCAFPYLVEVRLNERHLKYFFCADADRIELKRAYVLSGVGGKWLPISEEKPEVPLEGGNSHGTLPSMSSSPGPA